MNEFDRLESITRRLREPGGCPWDQEQTRESMRPHVIEEAYEVVDAIDRGSAEGVREELGDLLFLVFFFARLASEAGEFSIQDVARDISDKLVRRHPHVFGDTVVDGVKGVLSNWEKIKDAEKKSGRSSDGFLPALLRARKIQERAARQGFDWKNAEGVVDKIAEELEELRVETAGIASAPPGSARRREEELGDVLFTIVNLSRHIDVDPETALHGATGRFFSRFRWMEEEAQRAGLTVSAMTPDERESLWVRAKQAEAGGLDP